MRRICFLLLVATLAGCHTYQPEDRLSGFAAVAPDSGGVRLTVNNANHLWQPHNDDKQVVLKPGEDATIGDGYHVSATVRFVDEKDGRYRFRIHTTTYPPSLPPAQADRYVAVPAYTE